MLMFDGVQLYFLTPHVGIDLKEKSSVNQHLCGPRSLSTVGWKKNETVRHNIDQLANRPLTATEWGTENSFQFHSPMTIPLALASGPLVSL